MGISGSNAGYTMFRGSVKSTGYPLHSPVSPFTSPLVRHVSHHISTGLYHQSTRRIMPVDWNRHLYRSEKLKSFPQRDFCAVSWREKILTDFGRGFYVERPYKQLFLTV